MHIRTLLCSHTSLACADLAVTGEVPTTSLKPAAVAEIFRGGPITDSVQLVRAAAQGGRWGRWHHDSAVFRLPESDLLAESLRPNNNNSPQCQLDKRTKVDLLREAGRVLLKRGTAQYGSVEFVLHAR